MLEEVMFSVLEVYGDSYRFPSLIETPALNTEILFPSINETAIYQNLLELFFENPKILRY